MRAGAATRRFREGDARSLLEAYLTLIRGLRDQRRARTIELRSTDIEALARHLVVPGTAVVEQLADLMGATRSQRLSMTTLFSTGALVIGLTSSAAAVAASPPTGRALPAAGPSISTTTPVSTSVAAPVTIAEAPTPATTIAVPPEIIERQTPDASSTVEVPAPSSPTAPSSSTADPANTHGGRAPAGITPGGVPIDHTAPADASTDDAVAGTHGVLDGSTDDTVPVDIGTPPVPPSDSWATDSGVLVDIGTPPVPPSDAWSTDDGVLVDIGTPPLPPPDYTVNDVPPPDPPASPNPAD